MNCVQSGYKTITPSEIGELLYALSAKEISYRTVRVYFACLALLAVREAAKRSCPRRGNRSRERSRYRAEELCGLTGLAESAVLRELRVLKRAGIISFSESGIAVRRKASPESHAVTQALAGKRSRKRPVPIPRSVLRFLARSPKAVLGKTVVAYLFRGMSIDRRSGEVRGVGTVKASWIAEVMGVSLRAAKAARKELIALGLISKDTGSFQRKLNRDGAYFRLSLSWKGSEVAKARVASEFGSPVPSLRIAPRQPENRAAFAPPPKEMKTPYGSKDQKPRLTNPPGVSSIQGGGRGPTLRDVQMEDLLAYSRTEALYRQAVSARWMQDSEANLLNWMAAAVRAKTCRGRDPVRVFLGIVKRGLWNHITDADEERARRAINRFRYGLCEASA